MTANYTLFVPILKQKLAKDRVKLQPARFNNPLMRFITARGRFLIEVVN